MRTCPLADVARAWIGPETEGPPAPILEDPLPASTDSPPSPAPVGDRAVRAWLRGGSLGPTALSRRGGILVLLSILLVLVPIAVLTLLHVDAHVSLKVTVVTITVTALVGAVLRVIADARPTPRGDLDRAGKAVGAVAAVFTVLSVVVDWSIIRL